MIISCFKSVIGGLKILLNNFIIRKEKIFNALISLGIIILIILNSGNGYITFGASASLRMGIYAALLIILLLIFILQFDLNILTQIKQKKRPPMPNAITIYTAVMALAIIASMLANLASFSDNINTYIDLALTIGLSYLFVNVCSFKRFVKTFCMTLTVISLISLFLFIILEITHINFNTGIFRSSTRYYDNYFYLLFDYTDRFYNSFFNSRLMSIFWEPGVFASFLIIGLVFEIFYKEKTNYFSIALFLLCIVLTKSTAGYLILFFVAILFLSKL